MQNPDRQEGRLSQQQVAVAVALLSTQQFTDARRKIIAEATRITSDDAELERISSDFGVTVPDLKGAVDELRRLDRGTQPSRQTVSQHNNALGAIFASPQLRGVWNEFATKAQQTKDDATVISQVTQQTGQNEHDAKSAMEQIANYTPAAVRK
jgi:nitrous oxide reductase